MKRKTLSPLHATAIDHKMKTASKVLDCDELNLLLLKDDGDTAAFKSILQATSLRIANTFSVSSASGAIACIATNKVDLIFIDLSIPEPKALETFHSIARIADDIPIIILAQPDTKQLAAEALRNGAKDYLIKDSYEEALLEKSIRAAIERSPATATLAQSLRQYEVLFENNPMPSWAFDPTTFRIRMVNAAAVNHYGFSREEFLAMDVCQLRPETEVAAFHQFMSEHRNVQSWTTHGFPVQHRKKDGSLLDVEVSAEFIPGDDGGLVLTVINDVTEQKKAARLLAESEQRLNLAITAGRMVTMDYNYKTRQLKLSEHGKDIIGLDKEFAGDIKDCFSLIHPDDVVKISEAIRVGENGMRRDFQFRIVRPDTGKIVWVESRSNIVFDSEGVAEESRGVVVDITAFKQSQDYLLQSLKQLEEAASRQTSILNSVPAHIALIDHDGIIISVNDAWKKFAVENGLSDDQFTVGKSYFSNATHDPAVDVIYERIRSLLNGSGTAFCLEYPCHSPDRKRWFKVVASPLVANAKRGAVIMHIDITDRKMIEDDLHRSRADLVAIFDNTEDGYTLIDSDLRILAFNKRTQTNVADVMPTPYREGAFFPDYLPESRREIFVDKIAQASAGRTIMYDVEYESGLHGRRWFQLKIIPVINGDETAAQYILCAREFTNEKRAEIALRQREERFRAFIENSGDMFIITDVGNSNVTYVSPNIQKYLGYESGSILGHPFANLIHPDDAETYRTTYQNAATTEGKLLNFTVRIGDRQGNWLWVEGTVVNVSHIPSVNGLLSNFRDITEKIKTEEELRQNRYILEKANAAARIGYWVSDLRDEGKLQWSPAILQLFGIDEKNFDNRLNSFFKIVHPEDLPHVRAARTQAIKERKHYHIDHRVVRPDGKIVWINQQAEVFYDDAGNPLSMIGVSRDITEKKNDEEKIRKSKHNLDALINNTQDLMWSCDSDLRLVSANTAFRQGMTLYYGITLHEGDPVMTMKPETSDYALWTQRYKQALAGNIQNFEIQASLPESETYHFEVTLNPIIDRDEVVGVSGFVRDISEKKKTENKLRSFNERFEILSIATNDAVWDWDVVSNTMQWNHGLQSIFGYEPPERKTTLAWWMAQVHPDDIDTVNNSLLSLFDKKGTHWQCSYRFKHSDGPYVYIQDRGYVIYEGAKPVRMIGAIQDVHELTEYRISLEQKVKEHTAELHQALEKEKELSEMKSRFVSMASHEFRTPLSSIQFAADYLQLYRHKISDGEIQKKLDSITLQVEHMTYLLDDVLTIGKSESGKIAVNRSRVNFQSFFRDLVENVRHATQSTHEIVVTDSLEDKTCNTDEKLLFNIFSNLLSNAIKFSPGEEKVYLSYWKENGNMFFEVADNGIGINAGELCSVFEPFSRGSNAGAISGTGLGLAIVKTAVELLDGTVESFSTERFKTVFRVGLPCAD